MAGMICTTARGPSAVAASARSPSTKTVMWRRMAPLDAHRRSRMPGQRALSCNTTSPTLAASSSSLRGLPSNRLTSERGRKTSATSVFHHRRLDRQDRREIVGDRPPGFALVVAGVEVAGAGAEVDAERIEAVDRHGLPQHAQESVLLGQAVAEALPAVAGVAAA